MALGDVHLARPQKSAVKLYLDGRRVRDFSYDAPTGRLRYTSETLKPGEHKAKIVVRGSYGLGEDRTWRFRVLR